MSPTSRYPAATGRWRLDGTPEWFDLVDEVEAARILGGDGPPNRARLMNLRARGDISAADDSAATGPRWYRGDIERFLWDDTADKPLAPARAVEVACIASAIAGLTAIGLWVLR